MQPPFFRRLSAHGVLRMDGREALDLLHRLSTNAVGDMQPGDARETLLTTEKARIIDCVLVLAREDHVLLLVSPDRMTAVRSWLETYTIMEDIRYTDCSGSFSQSELIGLGDVEAEGFFDCVVPHRWTAREVPIGSGTAALIRHESIQGPGWRLLLPMPESDGTPGGDTIDAWLSEKGMHPIPAREYERWRISRGYPAVGFELTERVHPLEAGAERAVSFTKGCYIGQEVIARLDSQDKVQRRLRRLRIDAPEGMEDARGAELHHGASNAGFITSAIFDPPANSFAALGCVRTAFLAEGSVLEIRAGERMYRVTVLADDAGH
jgi:tRNA-modifying protein YgfZ